MRRRLLAPFVVGLLLGGCGVPDYHSENQDSPSETAPGRETPLPGDALVDRAKEAELNAEYFDRFIACMKEQGMTVNPVEGGGFSIDPGGGGDAALSQAEDECRATIGEDPGYAPVTADEAAMLYDAELFTKKCLENLGYAIPEAPSREEFIETYLQPFTGVSPWSAYGDIEDPLAVSDKCPPPSLASLG